MKNKLLISILARVKGNVNANGTIGSLIEIKKFFTTEGETRVFVSGRCVKYNIKQRLLEKGFLLSERRRRGNRGTQVIQSEGNPIRYIDDDLFGYMITRERRRGRREEEGEAGQTFRRFAPIKTDGIIALKHSEITRDFGIGTEQLREEGVEHPSPFEIEKSDFIGLNNWLILDDVGKFHIDELGAVEELELQDALNSGKIRRINKNGEEVYYLSQNERERRLRAFMEILLKERYTLPRATTDLTIPKYYYAMILLTNRLLPLFSSVDYEKIGDRIVLNVKSLKGLISLMNKDEKLFVFDYNGCLSESEINEITGNTERSSIVQILPRENQSINEGLETIINESIQFLMKE